MNVTVNFLAALSSVYNSKSVLVCLDDLSSKDDSYLDQLVSLSTNTNDNTSAIWTRYGLPNASMSPEQLLVFSQDSCPLDKYSEFKLRPGTAWLVSQNQSLPDNLRLDTDYITYKQNQDDIVLTEHYRIKEGEPKFNDIGIYTSSEGLKMTKAKKWARRSNFGGIPLVLSTVPWQPFIRRGRSRTLVALGMTSKMMVLMQGRMNFTIKGIMPRRPGFGRPSRSKNGTVTWTGIIGLLDQQRIDATYSGMSMSLERSNVIDFANEIEVEPLSLIMRKDALLYNEVNLTAFVKVFGTDTWLCTLGLFLACAVCVTVAMKYGSNGRIGSSFINAVIYCWHAMLQVSRPLRSNQLPHRILAISILTAFFVIYASYTGNLTARLTAGTRQGKISNFDDVLDAGLHLFITKNGISQTIFESAPPGSSKSEIYAKHSTLIDSRSVRKDVVPLLLEDPKNALLGRTRTPELKKVKILREKIAGRSAFGLQKDSEFREIFNYHIEQMRERGVLSQLYHEGFNDDKPPDASERIFSDPSFALGYENLLFPCLIFAGGTIIAIVAAGPERLMRRFIRRPTAYYHPA